MIIRAVDWWQPTRRQFGYLDKNTAQTAFLWVSGVTWFALKTKGANASSVGIGPTMVGSKNMRERKRLGYRRHFDSPRNKSDERI